VLEAEPGDAKIFFSALEEDYVNSMLEECRERLEKNRRLVIVESFNNAAIPYRGLDLCSFDLYAVVAPGQVLLYTAERACKALEVLGHVRSDKLVATLSQPLLSEPIPPATSYDELAEEIADSKIVQLLSSSV
jgi:predicted P-loop ATPase/GTPase